MSTATFHGGSITKAGYRPANHSYPVCLSREAGVFCTPPLFVEKGSMMRSYLGDGFPLRCFQRLSDGNIAIRRCPFGTTGTPGIPPSQSSRTRDGPPQISTDIQDRDRQLCYILPPTDGGRYNISAALCISLYSSDYIFPPIWWI